MRTIGMVRGCTVLNSLRATRWGTSESCEKR